MTLPTPTPAFHWSTETWGAALACGPLADRAKHMFTTRQLQLRGGPDTQPTEWTALATSVGVSLDRVVRVRQVHGRAVRVLRAGATPVDTYADRPDGDAIVSDVPGLALTVLVADCVPLLLVDRHRGVAAAIHAGWRGTCAGVVADTIDTMWHELGSEPHQILAAIGPSIRPCCYEVGEELVDAFRAAGHAASDIARWFTRVPPKAGTGTSLRLDVARANVDQLIAKGVPASSIFDCGLCTKTHRETFDSYRADGTHAGRMAAVIVVPPSLAQKPVPSFRERSERSFRGRSPEAFGAHAPPSEPEGEAYNVFSSIPTFDSRSASLFCSRGMCSNVTFPIREAKRTASPYSGMRPAFLTR
jgi:YfiH family protein